MRLIDADALPKYTGYALSADKVAMAVENAPTIDAVPVIRCKECKWYVRSMIKQDGTLDKRYKPDWCDLYSRVREETYFCANGERRDDE